LKSEEEEELENTLDKEIMFFGIEIKKRNRRGGRRRASNSWAKAKAQISEGAEGQIEPDIRENEGITI